MPIQQAVRKDKFIYIKVGGDWYYYNYTSPPIGGGSMGTVYLGRSKSTGNQVAIKQVAESIQNIPNIRSRARLEGGMKFRHHNLVEMIGYCELDHSKGPIWVVSKLVRGVNLDYHVNHNLADYKDALFRIIDTMYPVLDALSFLHSNGIFHLDIKPSNIMVEDGKNIRLMDLGICSQGIASVVENTGLLGTPQFAAPEQFHLDAENYLINASTDVYQVGITLYQLLTNNNPFSAPTIHECMNLHETKILPYHKGVPNEIVDVLRKATNPNQKYRFQTAEEFKIALKNTVLDIREKPKRKRLYLVIGAISIILIGLIIIILSL